MHSDFEEFAEEPKPKKIGKVTLIILWIITIFRVGIVSFFAFVTNAYHFTGWYGAKGITDAILRLNNPSGMIKCLTDGAVPDLLGIGIVSLPALANYYIIFSKYKKNNIIIFTVTEILLLLVLIFLARRFFCGPCDLECFQEGIKP